MKIVVSGAAGFLGSHLCSALLREGHEVVGVDNFYTSNDEKLSDLKNLGDFTFVKHDISQNFNLDADGYFNLACPASPIHYQRDPVQTIRTNVLGSINMLDLARKNSARIFQASTSEVYGDPAESPQVEEYWGNVNPVGIRSCYDEGKRTAETLFFDYHRQFGLDIKIARIFNTYGPGMHFEDGRVVSNFIFQALRGKNLTVYGNGTQTRSFCYVDDLIAGIVKLFFSDSGITGPINLGNPGEISMKDLAEKILQKTDPSLVIKYENLPSDDPKQRNPDITKAQNILSWEPLVELDEGLDRTISDFKERMSV